MINITIKRNKIEQERNMMLSISTYSDDFWLMNISVIMVTLLIYKFLVEEEMT